MSKIAFIHQGLVSFVEKDLQILQGQHDVHSIEFRGLRSVAAVWSAVLWADLTFCWFGKLHAFFAVLFSRGLGKKAVVVAGGDDVAHDPDMRYGMLAYWWKKWCPLLVFRHADLILSVSDFNSRETVANAGANPRKVKRVYHGFDYLRFKPTGSDGKERLAITVGGVDWERLKRKGYERFVKSAAYHPEVQFALVGRWHDSSIEHLRTVATDNVLFTGWVSDKELLQWFNRARVYVQGSVHEAFGCSVAEAMLCECVPVVSERAALPEVVGDCGFYVAELTPEAVASEIQKALASNQGKRARARIIGEFPLQKRRAGLLAAVDELMSR